jgi:hypothetical protein
MRKNKIKISIQMEWVKYSNINNKTIKFNLLIIK